MDEHDCHARQSKYHITSHMWNLKCETFCVSTKWKQIHRHREKTFGCQERWVEKRRIKSLGLADASQYIRDNEHPGPAV